MDDCRREEIRRAQRDTAVHVPCCSIEAEGKSLEDLQKEFSQRTEYMTMSFPPRGMLSKQLIGS